MTPIVYTMGKVGSFALATAIKSAQIPVEHIHTLDVATVKTQLVWSGKKSPPGHILASARVMIDPPQRPLWISAVRDPLARNLSHFFACLDRYCVKPPTTVDAALAAFRDYPHHKALDWFDAELYPRCPDTAAAPFDTQARYAQGSNWIIFRSDCPDDVKSRVLSERLGREIVVQRVNDTAEKKIADLYRQSRDLVSFSPTFIDEIYDSAFARRFWTEAEREAMRARWLRPAPTAASGDVSARLPTPA